MNCSTLQLRVSHQKLCQWASFYAQFCGSPATRSRSIADFPATPFPASINNISWNVIYTRIIRSSDPT